MSLTRGLTAGAGGRPNRGTVEGLLRHAHNLIRDWDVKPPPANHRVKKLVRRFVEREQRSGQTIFESWLRASLDPHVDPGPAPFTSETRIFLHPDPTGEHAVNRVVSQQKRQ